MPDTSSHHLAAQIAAVRIQVASRPGAARSPPTTCGRRAAGCTQLKLDAIQLAVLTAEILRAALNCVTAGRPWAAASCSAASSTERALRFGLERCYRAQARLAPDQRRRIELVDRANDVRPEDLDMTAGPPPGPGAACPSCGWPVGPQDNFCEACRTELAPAVVSGADPVPGHRVPVLPVSADQRRRLLRVVRPQGCRPAATTTRSISGCWPA